MTTRWREQEKLVRSISKLPTAERPLTILLAAHPYVSHDPFVGGVVEDALREQGACVLFADEADKARSLKKSYEFSHSIPWIVNRELIGATLLLHEHIDGIVLMSAYPCGPDSMCDDAIERCIKGKPILTLTVDAQAGTAGVETRVESFIDILGIRRSVLGRLLDVRDVVGQYLDRFGPPSVRISPENPCGVRISPENKAGVRKPPGNAVGPEHPPSIIAAICGHVVIYGYVMPCGYIRFISEPTLLYQSCQVGGQ